MNLKKYISASLGAFALTSALWSAGIPVVAQATPAPGFAPAGSAAAESDVEGPVIGRAQPARAQDMLNMKGGDRPVSLKNVTIEQRLNSQLPLDAEFRDESGKTVPLGSYFGKRPVVLALVYYDCPMLCTQILNGMVRAAKVLTFVPGKEYDVVAISFDARETAKLAAEKKALYLKRYGHPETADGWHFLTGDINSIKRVTDAVGFRYIWDVHTAQFAHASAIYVLTPEGRLSKYFYGIDYSPKDMRLGLIEASNNKIGNPVDQIMLFCYHFDPHSAKYTPIALGLLRVAGAATVLTLGGFVFIMLRRESRQKGSLPA